MSGLYRLMVKLSDQLITQKRALAAEAAAKLGGDGRSMGSLLRVGPSGAGGSLASRPELKTVSEEAAGANEKPGTEAADEGGAGGAVVSTPSQLGNQPEEDEEEPPGPFTQFQRLFVTPPRDAERSINVPRVEEARRLDLEA